MRLNVLRRIYSVVYFRNTRCTVGVKHAPPYKQQLTNLARQRVSIGNWVIIENLEVNEVPSTFCRPTTGGFVKSVWKYFKRELEKKKSNNANYYDPYDLRLYSLEKYSGIHRSFSSHTFPGSINSINYRGSNVFAPSAYSNVVIRRPYTIDTSVGPIILIKFILTAVVARQLRKIAPVSPLRYYCYRVICATLGVQCQSLRPGGLHPPTSPTQPP